MRFTVQQHDIWKGTQAALSVVPTKTTLPILSNIAFENRDNFLSIYATDLDVSIVTKIPVKTEEEGSITLPGKKIAEVIRELPDTPHEFVLERQQMMISGPSGVYKILGLPKDEFPEVPQSIEGTEVKIEGELLQRMIEKTVFAVSTDETRPALNGVLWQIKNNEMKMVATDGHRMAKIVRRKVKISEPDKDIIIPAKALHALSRFRNEMKDLSSVTIGENHILFDLKHTLIFSRLIAETYPNYERVIPQDNTNKLTVNKSLLSSSVRRVSILSNAITHQIRLSLKENAIALSALDQDIGGEAKEEISAAYDGEPMDVGYNAMYMLEILTQMESEDVVFELKTPTTAGLVHPTEQKENEDYLCLIMPLRLNN